MPLKRLLLTVLKRRKYVTPSRDHVREAAESVRRLRERGSMDKSLYRGFCEMGWEVKISRLKTG